jgi:hypothetical protein
LQIANGRNPRDRRLVRVAATVKANYVPTAKGHEKMKLALVEAAIERGASTMANTHRTIWCERVKWQAPKRKSASVWVADTPAVVVFGPFRSIAHRIGAPREAGGGSDY